MQFNTNYDLVECSMVVVIFKSLLKEKLLDLLVSLVAFVAPTAILLVISMANLKTPHLKCEIFIWRAI